MTNQQQPASSSSLEITRPLTENGNGVNLYLPPKFVEHLGFPLEAGDETTAVIVPDTAIVLFPGSNPTLPTTLDVRSTREYRVTDIPDTNTESESMIQNSDTTTTTRGDTNGA